MYYMCNHKLNQLDSIRATAWRKHTPVPARHDIVDPRFDLDPGVQLSATERPSYTTREYMPGSQGRNDLIGFYSQSNTYHTSYTAMGRSSDHAPCGCIMHDFSEEGLRHLGALTVLTRTRNRRYRRPPRPKELGRALGMPHWMTMEDPLVPFRRSYGLLGHCIATHKRDGW